jgi:predicted transcriptional regulator
MAERDTPGGAGPPEVSPAELKVLQSLWDHGPSTIRQLTERLYPAVTPANYATVQKLLERLEKTDDGYVTRDRSATPHVFAAAITRDAYIGGQLRAMARRLCGGSLTPLLTHLIRTEALSARDRSELRRLLEKPKKPDDGGKK